MSSAPSKPAPATEPALRPEDRERALQICRKWDTDGDGAISRAELNQALQTIFPGSSQEDVDNVLRSVDLNRDGIIQYEEFLNWIFQPSSDKLSFEDHLRASVFGSPDSLGVYPQPSAPPMDPNEDYSMADESQPKVEKGTSTLSTSSAATSSDPLARERKTRASDFLEAFTHPLLARFKVVSEKEASSPLAATVVSVQVEKEGWSPKRGGASPKSSDFEEATSASVQRKADGQLVIHTTAQIITASSGEQKLLSLLERLGTAYQDVLEAFCSELQRAKGSLKNPVLQFEPLPIFDEFQLPVRHAPEIALSAAALAITRLGAASRKQLVTAQVELRLLGDKNPNLAIYQESLARKASSAAAPLVINNSGRLSEKRGNHDWIRRDNGPEARLYRLQGFIMTQRAILAGGYELKSADAKPSKKVHLPKVVDMLQGTKVDVLGPASALRVKSPGHKTAIVTLEDLGLQEDATVMEVALKLARQGQRVAAVSAASAYHAGGGVSTGGRHALEEAWCMMTTLYQSLTAVDSHGVAELAGATADHADGPAQHIPTLGCVVSPQVEIFREPSSEGYGFLADPVSLSAVISVAMFNRNPRVSDSPLDSPDDPATYIHQTKAKLEVTIAAAINLGAEVLVICDVGCGVFQNDPLVIGGCLGAVLRNYNGYFKQVVFGWGYQFSGACKRVLEGGDPRELCPKGKSCTDDRDETHNARLAHPWRDIADESRDFVDKVLLGLVNHPEEVALPECRYGCYCRIKTPQHLASFSHPEAPRDLPLRAMDGRKPPTTPTGGGPATPSREPNPRRDLADARDLRTRPASPGLKKRPPSPGLKGRPASPGTRGVCAPCTPSSAKGDREPNPDFTGAAGAPGAAAGSAARPICKYGEGCYNKNPRHLAEFAHPWLEGESRDAAKKRRDEQISHELLNLAKDGKSWQSVKTMLGTHRHLVNSRPDTRNFALIHYACFQVQHPSIESLIIDFGADPNLLTKDGKTPLEVLTESMIASPARNATEQAKDEDMRAWLRRRAEGDSTGGLGRSTSTLSGAGAAATPSTPAAGAAKASSAGATLEVVHCLNTELNGEYQQQPSSYNGYPVYRKQSSGTFLTTIFYLFFHDDPSRGWVIDKDLRNGRTPLAYLGASRCGSDPCAKSYGEYWKVWRTSGIGVLSGGFHDTDAIMKVKKKREAGVYR